MTSGIKDRGAPAKACLADLLATATNANIKAKLTRFHAVCETIVLTRRERLTIAGAAKEFEVLRQARGGAKLAESSIRNRRDDVNPYLRLFQAWEVVAKERADDEHVGRKRHSNGMILSFDEVDAIEPISIQHRAREIVKQNISLQKQLDMLRKLGGQASITIAPAPGATRRAPSAQPSDQPTVSLSYAEAEAIRNFIERLDGDTIRKTPDEGVRIVNGPYIADPGFVTALQKILDEAGGIPF